jgi:hypothetical protein
MIKKMIFFRERYKKQKEPVDANNKLFYAYDICTQHPSLLVEQCAPPPENKIAACAYIHFYIFFNGANIHEIF